VIDELRNEYTSISHNITDHILPDTETGFEDYTTMEPLSVAMLIVISTFALDFIHSDRYLVKSNHCQFSTEV
jgi:hypothetical protein